MTQEEFIKQTTESDQLQKRIDNFNSISNAINSLTPLLKSEYIFYDKDILKNVECKIQELIKLF